MPLLQEILKKAKGDDIIVRTTKNNYNSFEIIPYSQITSVISVDNQIAEVLYHNENFVYKFYLDIDFEYQTKGSNIDIENEINEILMPSIYNLLKINHEYDYNTDDIIILKADRYNTSKKKFKFSRHILFPIYIENILNIKRLLVYIKCELKNIISSKLYEAIDEIPYIINKEKTTSLRMINQTKPKEPDSILIDDNYSKSKNYLISQLSATCKDLNPLDASCKDLSLNFDIINKYYTKHTIKNNIKVYDNSCNTNIAEAITIKTPDIDNNINKYTLEKITSIVKEFNITNVKSLTYLYLLSIPNKAGNIDYFTWYKILNISISQNIPLEYIKEWTRNAYENLSPAEIKIALTKCLNIYKYCLEKYNKRKLDERIEPNSKYNTLICLASKYNKYIYYNILTAVQFNKDYNILAYCIDDIDILEIDNKAVLNIDKYINDNTKQYTTVITNLNVGSAKTNSTITATINYLKSVKSSFFIAISNRQIYGRDLTAKINISLIKNVLKPCLYYEDITSDFTAKQVLEIYNGLVISIESLLKNIDIIKDILKTIDNNYLFILDEFETIHNTFNSSTLENREIATLAEFIEIWGNSHSNIILDAFLSSYSLNFIKSLNNIYKSRNNHIFIHQNDYNNYPKTFNIKYTGNCDKSINRMEELLFADILSILNADEGNTVCIFCELPTIAESMKNNLILKGLNTDDILLTTGKEKDFLSKEDNEKNMSCFTNKTNFEKKKVWIYNTSVINGVSIENIKFTSCYAMINSGSEGISANDILNAVARARLNNEWNVYIIEYKSRTTRYFESINSNSYYISQTLVKIENLKNQKKSHYIEYNNIEGFDNEYYNKMYDDALLYNTAILDEKQFRIIHNNSSNITEIYDNDTNLLVLSISYEDLQIFKNNNLIYYNLYTGLLFKSIGVMMDEKNNTNMVNKIENFRLLATLKGNTVNVINADITMDYKNIDKTISYTRNLMSVKNLIIDTTNIHTNLNDTQVYCHYYIEKIYPYHLYPDNHRDLLYLMKDKLIRETFINIISYIEYCYDNTKNKSKYNIIYVDDILNKLLEKQLINDNGLYKLLSIVFKNYSTVMDEKELHTITNIFTIDTDTIINCNLYDDTLEICNSFKRANRIKVNTITHQQKPLIFIRNFNEIFKSYNISLTSSTNKNIKNKVYTFTPIDKVYTELNHVTNDTSQKSLPIKELLLIAYKNLNPINKNIITNKKYDATSVLEIIQKNDINEYTKIENEREAKIKYELERPERERIENEKLEREKQRKIEKHKKQLIEAEEDRQDNLIILQRYNKYLDEFNVTDTELLEILINIINTNNEKLKDVKDKNLRNGYLYYTHIPNYNTFKMTKYIMYQEKFLA